MEDEIIEPITIKTDEALAALLRDLGFVSRKVNFDVNKLEVPRKIHHEPRRLLIAQDNALLDHALVMVVDNAFYIYYYDEWELFCLESVLYGPISRQELRNAIKQIMMFTTDDLRTRAQKRAEERRKWWEEYRRKKGIP